MLLSLLAVAAEDERPPIDLDVGPARKISDVSLVVGEGALHLDDARVAPILHEARVVGVAIEGGGSLTYTFRRRGYAQALANRNVLWFGGAVEAWRPLARLAAPLTTEVDQAIVFLPDDQLAALLEGEATEASPGWADKRLDVLDHCIDLRSGLRRRSSWQLLDTHTDTRFGLVATGSAVQDDTWLTIDQDPVAYTDTSRTYAVGRRDSYERCHILDTGASPKAHPPWSKQGEIDIDLRVMPSAHAGKVAVSSTATLRFTPTLATDRLWMYLGEDAELELATLDGVALEWIDDQLLLPGALDEGRTHELVLRMTEEWDATGSFGDGTRATSTRGVMPFLPTSGVWTGTLRTFSEDFDISQVGRTVREGEELGVRTVESAISDLAIGQIAVSAGRWASRDEAAVEGLPAVRARVFTNETQSLEQWGPLARLIVTYYHQLLPPLHVDELEIYQMPDGFYGSTWTAVPGLIRIQQAVTVYESATDPHVAEVTLAHEIAHQWWGARVNDATRGDRWMMETLAQVYSCAFARAAYSPSECRVREKRWQKTWESHREIRDVPSLSAAGHGSPYWTMVAYGNGPVLFGRTLPAMLGPNAVYGGYDRFARAFGPGRPATTRALRLYLEQSSGQDLEAFFDFWVHGGLLPEITLHRGATTSRLSVDVPFGTVQVPIVRVMPDGTESTEWISVVDGEAEFPTGGAKKLLLDPDKLVPARSRKSVSL